MNLPPFQLPVRRQSDGAEWPLDCHVRVNAVSDSETAFRTLVENYDRQLQKISNFVQNAMRRVWGGACDEALIDSVQHTSPTEAAKIIDSTAARKLSETLLSECGLVISWNIEPGAEFSRWWGEHPYVLISTVSSFGLREPEQEIRVDYALRPRGIHSFGTAASWFSKLLTTDAPFSGTPWDEMRLVTNSLFQASLKELRADMPSAWLPDTNQLRQLFDYRVIPELQKLTGIVLSLDHCGIWNDAATREKRYLKSNAMPFIESVANQSDSFEEDMEMIAKIRSHQAAKLAEIQMQRISRQQEEAGPSWKAHLRFESASGDRKENQAKPNEQTQDAGEKSPVEKDKPEGNEHEMGTASFASRDVRIFCSSASGDLRTERERAEDHLRKPRVEIEYEVLDPLKSAPISDKIHFTATYPAALKPASAHTCEIWAHLMEQRESVLAMARSNAESRAISHRTQGPVKITRGTEMDVTLRVTGMEVEPERSQLLWDGEIANAGFLITVPPELGNGSYGGKVTVFVGGIPIATIPLCFEVRKDVTGAEQVRATARCYSKAFASYASKDRNEVLARLQGIQKVLPELDIFLDVARLQSGDRWPERLKEEILSRDVLYLFWSKAASESVWVEKEWRCALTEKGIDAIDPVPLVTSSEVRPPKELSGLHFNDWVLAFKRGESNTLCDNGSTSSSTKPTSPPESPR